MSPLPEGVSAASPTVTIAVPVRDDETALALCLEAIQRQDYPPDRIEVLVIDGGSRDGSRAVVERVAAGDPRFLLLDNPAGRVATALNIALRRSSGDYFVRIDAHALVAPDYVRLAVERLRESGADNVGGPMAPRGTTPQSEAIACGMRSRFGVGPARFRYARQVESVDTVYLGAFPRARLEQLGGFDASLLRNQDYELNYRIRRAGGTILVDPALTSTYFVRSDLGALARQFLSYGYWKVQMLRRHPASLRPRQLAAPALVAALAIALLALVAALVAPLRLASLALLAPAVAILYAAASLVAAAAAARSCGWRVALRLPAVFATMHLAWGAGFWCGIARPPLPHVLSHPAEPARPARPREGHGA